MSDSNSGWKSSPSLGHGAVFEALLRYALADAAEGFWAVGPTTGEFYLSPRCRELLGFGEEATADQIAGWRELICPEDLEAALGMLTRVREGIEPGGSCSVRLRRPGNEPGWRWVAVQMQAEAEPLGGGLILGTVEDITEQRRAEEALRQSEERYRELVESQGEGIGIVDELEVFTFGNPAAHEIFGVAAGELEGRSLAEFLDEGELERIEAQTDGRRQGRRDTYEVTIRRPDGELRTLLVTATAQFDEAGGYLGAFGVFRDITERKNAERAVRESEERYRQLIDSLPLGVLVLVDEEVKFVNKPALQMLGSDERGGLDREALEAMTTGDGDEASSEALSSLISGDLEGPTHGFFRVCRPDGVVVPLELFATRVTYEGQRAEQLVMMDVTDRLEAERQREMLEMQLRQAHKMESVGRLAGGIAHDLNNMLAPILSLAETVQEEVKGDEALISDMQTIIEAAERARDLTQQLLAFGRKQVLRMVVVDFNSLVRASFTLLRRLLPESLTLELELDEAAGSIRADAAQINQVLMNLCLNARDATAEVGEVIIRTSSREVDGKETEPPLSPRIEPGRYTVLEVSDDGHGMDQETAARIFEPFFTTKEKGQGTGLGLAMVHGIVRQHGGHVEVDSAPGQGATFTLLLPRVAASSSGVVSLEKSEGPVGRAAVVLVVEDDGAVRRAACRILSHQGFQTVQARDGEEALVLLRRQGPVDVVLTDVVMPRMNGQELAGRLAMVAPEIPVVFMSGYTDDVVAYTGVLDEGMMFVQKPFSARSLLTKIDEALTISGAYRRSSAPPPR